MAGRAPDVVADALARFAGAHPGADVLDVGGGSGARAVPLAIAGCKVLVVDASADALASLGRRAADAGVSDRVRALQADADRIGGLLPADSVDLVLYHNVVQDLDDPPQALRAAVGILRTGGTLSILVPGLLSAVLADALEGDDAGALAALSGAGHGRYDVPALRALLADAGLSVQSIVGVGVLAALVGGRTARWGGHIPVDLERELGRHPVLGQIAESLHALAVRAAP